MGLIAKLLKDVPAAAKYQEALEAMEKECAALKAENAGLREELSQYIDKWETLDGDAVRTLQYLAQFERGEPAEIARVSQVNIQCVESQLKFLAAWKYVNAPVNGTQPHFAIAIKGRRYLEERGLIKAA